MATRKGKRMHQAQTMESTSAQTATEKKQEEKQDGKADVRTKESRTGESAETVDSGQNEAVSTATSTAAIESPVQETDCKEETEGAVAAARLDLQAQDSLKKKKDTDAEVSLQTDFSDDVTESMKSLQLQDATRTPLRQHPGETTEGQQVPGSKTGKEDERCTVAEALATAPGIEEEVEDEEDGSKKKKKTNKRKTDNKEQPDENPILGVESTKAQRNSDQKEGTVHTGYTLDRHARNRELSEAAKFFLQSLDEESTESEPSLDSRSQNIISCVPFEDITKQLFLKMRGRRITILHGPDGCGKTLTAHFMRNVFHHLGLGDVRWCTHSTLPEGLKDKHKKITVYIVGNFLGCTSFEGFPKWRPVYNILRGTLGSMVHVLLVMRTSILEQVLASTGADFADILNSSVLVELSVDYQTMYNNMLSKAKLPDFNAIPDIGFPVCCKLASSMAGKERKKLFQNPRLFLRELIKGLMENTAALLSLGLLAVTEGYVNARELRHPARLNKSVYLQVLQSMETGIINEQRVVEIIDFYNETQGLVQVEDDFVSFTNEAVREAVLCVLCKSHAQFLAKHCSLRLLSRLALVTCDPNTTKDDDGKPVLPTSARKHFLQRLLNEMTLRNYRESLPCALFAHSSFHREFQAKVSEKSLINTWLSTNDKGGLHFLFWASACEAVTELLVSLKAQRSKEVIWQGVLGCCYWGNKKMLKELLSKWSRDDKKFMLTAKIKDFVKKVEDFNWDETPFYPDDTLLTLAAWRGKDDVVMELLDMKADVNFSGHNDLTALMHYCARGNVDMVNYLFRMGASIQLQDDIGNTALHYALIGGLESLHDGLFHGGTIRLANHQLQTPLVVACGSGAPQTLLDKLRRGAQEEKLYPSLLFACYKGQTDVVKYLLENTNENQPIPQVDDSIDALQLVKTAIGCDRHEEIVEILLPKVQTKTNIERLCELCTKLCACKDHRAVKEFLPLVKDSFDYDLPLIFACILGNESVVDYLLENQPSQTNKELVLEAATCMGSWDFMKWALAATKTPITMEVIKHAMMSQQSELVKLLVTSCNTKTGDNPSFLNLAAQHDLLPVMKWLLDDKRMDVNLTDKHDVHPLSIAIEFGKEKAVKCLVNYGANITEDIKEDLHRHRATEFKNDRLCKAMEKTVQFLAEEESK